MYSKEHFASSNEVVEQIVRDWLPALVLGLVYTSLRRIIDTVSEVNVEDIYKLEKALFGVNENNEILAFVFAGINQPLLTIFSVFTYSLHFVVPTITIIYIGYVKPDREVFSKFRVSFLLITVMGFVTFILFPVAPPWYVLNYGLEQPHNFTGTSEGAAGLLKFDELIGITVFGLFYGSAPPAPFAAFPSLHAGWSFLYALVLSLAYGKRNKKIYLTFLYPIAVCFSTIYLQHHYVIDLVGGIIYAILAYAIGVKVILPLYHKYYGETLLED